MRDYEHFCPCDICINNLRIKLFKLKSNFNMLSYNQVNKFIKNNIEDHYSIYSDAIQNPNLLNLEHVVPVNILSVDKRPDRNKININYEPVSDAHLLIPCATDINYLRSNKCYGIVAKNRSEAIDKKMLIINNNYVFNAPLSIKNKFKHLNESSIDKLYNLDEKDDMYIFDDIFQPSNKYRGDLSRIVFYYYLMYGFDFTKRPITKCKNVELLPNESWFGNFSKDRIKCYNFEDWTKYFFDHINNFKEWAKNEIIDEEHTRNKNIIKNLGVPNIFIGFTDSDNKYVSFGNDIIDELFFGKNHDHNKYLDINFLELNKKDSLYFKNRLTKNKLSLNISSIVYSQNEKLMRDQINLINSVYIPTKFCCFNFILNIIKSCAKRLYNFFIYYYYKII